MKYWEIIANNLSKAGWSWGCVSAIDSNGRKTIFIADAHRDDGKRFVAPQAGEGRLLRGLREDAARLSMDRDVELRIRWRDVSERDQRIKCTQLIRVQLIRELSR
jgi:hypothetical protein